MASTATEDDLSLAFFALSDPTRRSILARLAEDDSGIVDLTAHFEMSQPAITKHVHVLERAGLVSRRKEGQRRPCHLEADRLAQLSEWLGSDRQYWEASFDRLDDYIGELTTTSAPDPNKENSP